MDIFAFHISLENYPAPGPVIPAPFEQNEEDYGDEDGQSVFFHP